MIVPLIRSEFEYSVIRESEMTCDNFTAMVKKVGLEILIIAIPFLVYKRKLLELL
jgi:hypothetical protein